MSFKHGVLVRLVGLALLLAGCSGPAVEPAASPPSIEIETQQGRPEPTDPYDKPTAEAVSTDEAQDLEEATRPMNQIPFDDKADKVDAEFDLPSDPAAKGRVSFARSDLARKLNIQPETVELSAYETVVWRDGSLGCPQPGMMYTQALVDGYVIRLVVDGESYNYHGATGRDPFLCEN